MNDRLLKIVNNAYTTVPFYKKVAENNNLDIEHCDIGKQWNEIPVIDKNMMLDIEKSIISSDYWELYFKEKIITTSTSGSTGKCFEIFWSTDDFKKSLLPLWVYRKRYYGISPEDKQCYFFTSRLSGKQELEVEYSSNKLGFGKCCLDHEKLKSIYAKMLEYQPKWMILQPSIALILSEFIRKNQLERIESLEYIELTGEMLFPDTREEIRNAFSVKICNQYGCNEANSIAYECPEGNLHCVANSVFVEILKNGKKVRNGLEGDIHITSLHNSIMPFIRYNIGDRGSIDYDTKCKCGNKNPILKLAAGRCNDWIYDEDGNRINTYVFLRAIENTNQELDYIIKQFQIIQNDYNEFTVKFVVKEDECENNVASLFLENIIEPKLDNATYHFEFYDLLLPEEKNGKLLYFKSELTNRQIGAL